jgi:hypothetical protein
LSAAVRTKFGRLDPTTELASTHAKSDGSDDSADAETRTPQKARTYRVGFRVGAKCHYQEELERASRNDQQTKEDDDRTGTLHGEDLLKETERR